jgi:hypothetical protein
MTSTPITHWAHVRRVGTIDRANGAPEPAGERSSPKRAAAATPGTQQPSVRCTAGGRAAWHRLLRQRLWTTLLAGELHTSSSISSVLSQPFTTCARAQHRDQLFYPCGLGKQDRLVDVEDYSSSGAKLTWRLINKVINMSCFTSICSCKPCMSTKRDMQLLHCNCCIATGGPKAGADERAARSRPRPDPQPDAHQPGVGRAAGHAAAGRCCSGRSLLHHARPPDHQRPVRRS